jgi:hypothetical protein
VKHLVKTYEENYSMLERFITSTLLRFNNNHELTDNDLDNMFKLFPSLELVYKTDLSFIQTSPNLERNSIKKNEHIGIKREYLLYIKKGVKREFSDLTDIVIKQPYISSATGHLCITVIQKQDYEYLFFDFELEKLLKRFGLYNNHKIFEIGLKLFYSLMAFSLIGIAIFLSGYGLMSFFLDNFTNPSLDNIFKPVVALTLGLAIFDLGKTIFEQEVLSNDNETFKPKTLMNFTVSIIIALMIEALLIVFKISLSNYQDLVYSLYLIAGSSMLFATFTLFYFIYKKSKKG